MKKPKWLADVVSLYVDGFRNMTIGRSLWLLIILKLLVFFVVIKLLFFPDVLKEHYDSDEARAEAVRESLSAY